MTTQEKLCVLVKAAEALDRRAVVWAVGASALLYCKGIVTDFHDIDLMVAEEDASRACEALLSLGALVPSSPSPQYRTRLFREFLVDGVEIDLIAGFSIVCDGQEHYFPLKREDIQDTALINGRPIPLQPLQAWRRYYSLMGRGEKVRLIDQALGLGSD